MTARGAARTEEVQFDLRGIDQMALCGPADQNLRRLERRFDGTVSARGDRLRIVGPADQVPRIRDVVADLLERVRRGQRIDAVTVDYLLAGRGEDEPAAELIAGEGEPLPLCEHRGEQPGTLTDIAVRPTSVPGGIAPTAPTAAPGRAASKGVDKGAGTRRSGRRKTRGPGGAVGG